jgi:hypothetical protein
MHAISSTFSLFGIRFSVITAFVYAMKFCRVNKHRDNAQPDTTQAEGGADSVHCKGGREGEGVRGGRWGGSGPSLTSRSC